jgi:hypothetical protein
MIDYDALLAIALPDDDCQMCAGQGFVRQEIRNHLDELAGWVDHPCRCRRDKVARLLIQ